MPLHTLPVLPARWLQLALLAQTNSKFSMRLLKSNLTSFDKQKSMTYFTPNTVIELSAILVERMTLNRLFFFSSSLLVIYSVMMEE